LTEFDLEKFLEYLEIKKDGCRIKLNKPSKKGVPKNWLIGCIAGLTIASYFFREDVKKWQNKIVLNLIPLKVTSYKR